MTFVLVHDTSAPLEGSAFDAKAFIVKNVKHPGRLCMQHGHDATKRAQTTKRRRKLSRTLPASDLLEDISHSRLDMCLTVAHLSANMSL